MASLNGMETVNPLRGTRTVDVRGYMAPVVPGLVLAAVVAAAATEGATLVPLGSAPVLAIVLGVVVGSAIGPRPHLKPGLALAGSSLLRLAVVLLGTQLPLTTIGSEGLRSLPVIAVTLTGALALAGPIGRRLGIADRAWTLIGVGTAICGASAIAAVTPVIEADELEVGLAVATIFLFNVLAVVIFPSLGHALQMSPHTFGVFAGTAVNDLSSVVAAAGAYSGSLHAAVITKLTRTLMIVPICVGLGALYRHRSDRRSVPVTAPAPRRVRSLVRLVPGFLLAFLGCAALRSLGVVPPAVSAEAGPAATVLITMALAGIGLSVDLEALRRVGPRPVVLGLILWLVVTVLALGVLLATAAVKLPFA